ncbi:dihydrodipicolinate synthase family protein [Devosia sp.]|uniref:dihydrodipicolinate synthase family protein n=1 Tax=Devosia sp. TaxID=1871048 RepID=UPI003A8E4569
MATARPHGNWASLLLPIADDDSIDFSRLAEAIDSLIAAGVDGIYSNGTACEFYAQTEAEFDAIQALLAGKCSAAGMAFMIGASQTDPILQLARIRRAAQLRPRAIQVILPDWWPVSNDEARAFLLRASEAAAGIDLVLYNPPHAKRVLAPADLAIATDGTAVVATKLTMLGDDFFAEARQHLSHLAVFVPGHHLATGQREGVAAGAFSNVACLSPRGAQRWTDLMATDLAAALEIETRLRAFITGHIMPFAEAGYSNAALDKLLAAIGGWANVGTRLRAPYRSIPETEALALRAVAMAQIPEIMLT